MLKKLIVLGFLAFMVPLVAVAAGDAKAGQSKSALCASCHGPAGISSNPMWPNLAGQKEAYLAKQMRDFRDGKRQDPMMAPMAMNLSDQDIEDLAAYYAAQPAK